MEIIFKALNTPIAGTLLMILTIILGYWITSWRLGKKAREASLVEKVNVVDCNSYKKETDSFKRRFGKEVDEHSGTLIRIEKALIFLVTENGGDPQKMGLMG